MLVRVLAANPSELQQSCNDCRIDRCFNRSSVLQVKSQRLPVVECTRADWWKLVDAIRKHFGNDKWGPYAALVEYEVCRRSIITPLSLELVRLYSATAGTRRIRTPEEYYNLPAFWIDVVNVIDNERAAIMMEQRDGA